MARLVVIIIIIILIIVIIAVSIGIFIYLRNKQSSNQGNKSSDTLTVNDKPIVDKPILYGNYCLATDRETPPANVVLKSNSDTRWTYDPTTSEIYLSRRYTVGNNTTPQRICLDAPSENSEVITTICNDSSKWKLSNGKIINQKTNKCIGLANNKLVLKDCSQAETFVY